MHAKNIPGISSIRHKYGTQIKCPNLLAHYISTSIGEKGHKYVPTLLFSITSACALSNLLSFPIAFLECLTIHYQVLDISCTHQTIC